jgi:DNA-binding XRE family transcriptional regulator
MSGEETDKLLAELKEWCSQKRGRQAEIAKMLGITRQSINEWFTGDSSPSLEAGLKVQAFLRKQRRRPK